MTDEKKETTRKSKPKYNPHNKEQGSNKNKKRWKHHKKQPKVDLGKSLQELQSYINGEYHAP